MSMSTTSETSTGTEVLRITADSLESSKNIVKVPGVTKEDDLNYDIGNLAAFDTHAIDMDKFNENKAEYLKEYARENVQLLIARIFQLPSEQTEDGLFAALPEPTTAIPREKPVPKPKEQTKWQQFAQKKGIRAKNREKLVYDKNTDEFRGRFGFQRANNKDSEIIVPAKPTDQVGSDPFIEARMAKRVQMLAQKKREITNTRRSDKKQNKIPGQISVTNALRPGKGDYGSSYDIAAVSTASMGKFDRRSGIEKTRKTKELLTSRKNKSLMGSAVRVTVGEKEQSRQVLNRVLKVEAKRREKVLEQSAKVYQKSSEKDKRKEKKVHLLADRKERFAKKQKK